MGIITFINKNGKLTKTKNGLQDKHGFWNVIEATDIDKDGDIDFLVGNLGTNTSLTINEDSPAVLIADDFDQNGSFDPILFNPVEGKLYPVASRDMLLDQVPYMRKRFTSYKDFSKAGLEETLTKKEREGAYRLVVNETASGICSNNGDGQFQFFPFPLPLQVAPIQTIQSWNHEGETNKYLMGGNRLHTEVASGQYDAFAGLLIYDNNQLKVHPLPKIMNSDFGSQTFPHPEIKSIKKINLVGDRKGILVGSVRRKLCLLIEAKE